MDVFKVVLAREVLIMTDCTNKQTLNLLAGRSSSSYGERTAAAYIILLFNEGLHGDGEQSKYKQGQWA
jgi:hypothetical protein